MGINQRPNVMPDSLTRPKDFRGLFNLRPSRLQDHAEYIDLRHGLFKEREVLKNLFGDIRGQWC